MGCSQELAKRTLRTRYRRACQRLSAAAQQAHAQAVASAVAERLRPPASVGVYAASDGEVDLAPLVEACWRLGVDVSLPVVGDRGAMRFARYRRCEPMRRNRFDILEPVEPAATAPVLVLAPLVAFDADGNRMGRGGGYYDRYFAAHPAAQRIGIAHECQRAPALPASDHDVPLAAVVTERGWQDLPVRR